MERHDYFFAKVEAFDCWYWTAQLTPDGYGRFWDGTRMVMAHRWAYEYLTGDTIGELTVDHRCKVTACVNPDHMEIVTDEENRERGACKYAALIAKENQTHCKHGHEFTDENTYLYGKGRWRGCRACRRRNSNASYRRITAASIEENA